MKNVIYSILGILILVGIVYLLSISRTKIVPEFELEPKTFIVTITVYENERAVRAFMEKFFGHSIDGVPKGMANLYIERDPKECHLHVLKPKYIDDDITLTWGHELAHCVYGRYHK